MQNCTTLNKVDIISVLEFEKVYLSNIPSAESYEKSFMHRDVISHILVTV